PELRRAFDREPLPECVLDPDKLGSRLQLPFHPNKLEKFLESQCRVGQGYRRPDTSPPKSSNVRFLEFAVVYHLSFLAPKRVHPHLEPTRTSNEVCPRPGLKLDALE